jgi:tetratricopeptide (TPR) repeat protein
MPAMRFFISIAVLVLAWGPTPAWAEDGVAVDQTAVLVENRPGPLAPDDAQLDGLFARLKKERSPESARAIADQIRETMALSGSPTIDMLMANAAKATADKRFGAALDFLDQVTLLQPDFAEGWNRRATVHFVMGNLPKAVSDTARVLALEPRHLGALAGLAGIMADTGRDGQALQTWETYLSYYPADRQAQKQALDLVNKLAGQKT